MRNSYHMLLGLKIEKDVLRLCMRRYTLKGVHICFPKAEAPIVTNSVNDIFFVRLQIKESR